MTLIRKRPVTAQRIAYWKAAEFLGSGAHVFKRAGIVCTVGFWTIDPNTHKRVFETLGEGASWNDALAQAKAAVAALRKRP